MHNVSSTFGPRGDHYGYALQDFSANHPELVHTLASIYGRIRPLLTKENIEATAKSWLKAKALPLSTPESLAKEIKSSRKNLARLKNMRKITLEELQACKKAISHLKTSKNSPKRLEAFKNQKKIYEERLEGLFVSIPRWESYLKHLQLKKTSTISARFTGLASSVADFAVPGSAGLAKIAITTATAAAPVKSAASMKNSKEIEATRKSALLVTLGFLVSTAASYYILPTIQQVAMHALNFTAETK